MAKILRRRGPPLVCVGLVALVGALVALAQGQEEPSSHQAEEELRTPNESVQRRIPPASRPALPPNSNRWAAP